LKQGKIHRNRKKKKKKRGHGIGVLAEPGYGSLFVRTAWMNKIGKRHKVPRVLRKRPTDR